MELGGDRVAQALKTGKLLARGGDGLSSDFRGVLVRELEREASATSTWRMTVGYWVCYVRWGMWIPILLVSFRL